MDETGKRWDYEVIDGLFNNRDAALIKRIPIPMIDKNDSWFWLLDDSGDFTVKSAYRWLQGELDTTHKSFWHKLWSLKLPGKVTHFIWRVCKGCLPTANALMIKRVMQSNRCPWCGSATETDSHVLFNCDFARTVWNMVGLQQVVRTVMPSTAFEVFLQVFEAGNREQCVQIGMIAWVIWSRRNKWVWENINGSAYGVKVMATNYLTEWKNAQVKHVRADDQFWRKPMAGWIKINTDAAVFPDGGVGVGCVLRDEQGLFLGARNCKIAGAWSPKEAEAIGMKEALSWLISRKTQCCILETDSQVLVNACNGNPGEAIFGTIVGDCIQLLKHINSVLLRFVYRSANRVAHVLATYSMSEEREWIDIPPDFISHVLKSDLE